MDGNVWYVCSRETHGGMIAWAQSVRRNENLVPWFEVQGMKTMNACRTKGEAQKIAAEWNESYIKNGTAAEWLR